MSGEVQPAALSQETHEERIRRELGLKTYELIEGFEDKCLDSLGLTGYASPSHAHMELTLKTPENHQEKPVAIKILNREQKLLGDSSFRGLEVYKEHGAEGGNHFSMQFYIDIDGSVWQPPEEGRWERAILRIDEHIALVDILEEFNRSDFDFEVSLIAHPIPF